MASSLVLGGPVHRWSLGQKDSRDYMVVTVPFGIAKEVFKPELYNALTGRGEQRAAIKSHVRKLRKEITEGRYTPTPFGVSLSVKQQAAVKKSGDDVQIKVSSDDPLKQTDGGHRFAALHELLEELDESPESQEAKKAINELPITAVVYLNGDPQQDFVNLQAGRTVDTNHILSMKIRRDMLSPSLCPYFRLAFDVAKILNMNTRSPFRSHIKFDSRGTVASLKFSTIAAKGSSDAATSLLGFAKIAKWQAAEGAVLDEWCAQLLMDCLEYVRNKAPELLAEGMPLTPPPDGTAGAATMIVGMAAMMAFRLRATQATAPTETDFEKLVDAARSAFGDPIQGNFSAQAKRVMMNRFVTALFDDVEVEKYAFIPKDLLTILSCSAFGLKNELNRPN